MLDLKRPVSSFEDPWERVNAWPDGKPLKTKEAAIFMRYSVATLARMRKKGNGPDYFQGGIKQDGRIPRPSLEGEDWRGPGVNQHIHYFKEDIQAWQKAGKVSNTLEAAIRKGQLRTFSAIGDLLEELPYYIDPMGRVEACVEDLSMQTLIERLDVWEIEWLPAVEAAAKVWTDREAQKKLADAIKPVLKYALERLDTGIEASELNAEGRRK